MTGHMTPNDLFKYIRPCVHWRDSRYNNDVCAVAHNLPIEDRFLNYYKVLCDYSYNKNLDIRYDIPNRVYIKGGGLHK